MLLHTGIHTAFGDPNSTQPAATSQPRQRPVMGRFMGLNVHTVQFKPQLYAAVCREVRDYHPVAWDIGDDASKAPAFPRAANGVDWDTLYGSWRNAGFDIDVCLMFDQIAPARFKDARQYGQAFARCFGPSGTHPLVSSVEIGNEPSKYSEAEYRDIFEKMAGGLRAGDPKLKIATCALMAGKGDQWSKPLSAIAGVEPLYDVLNIHSYPFKEKWPTWQRSFPEDPAIQYVKVIDDLVRWRDAHAPGKEIWLTEFGYDSASKPPAPDGPWKQWVGVSDEQQARYIVRSFLLFASLEIDRADLFFFNDQDEPQLHGASGITRNFRPKPSFYAMSFLYRALADYRFVCARAQHEGDLYCFEFEKDSDPSERIEAIWLGTGEVKSAKRVVSLEPSMTVDKVQRLPMSADAVKPVEWRQQGDQLEVTASEMPVFVWVREKK